MLLFMMLVGDEPWGNKKVEDLQELFEEVILETCKLHKGHGRKCSTFLDPLNIHHMQLDHSTTLLQKLSDDDDDGVVTKPNHSFGTTVL